MEDVQDPDEASPPEEYTPARQHHVFRFWSWELASLLVAIALIAATYSILTRFDGQRVPEWPFSINLNTLVALFSTIMRAAMLVGVTEVIGQTKWVRFSRPRPLSHLQSFDVASRSVFGSLSLLFVAPGSALGVLGALITIFSLGIGPFTQQAIKSVPCLQVHTELKASLPLAHFVAGYDTFHMIEDLGMYEVQTDMKGAMVNGIANPTGNDSAIVPICATGNCSFASHNGITHSSIGLCSSCIDTTPFIRREMLYGHIASAMNYTLPNGLWVCKMEGLVYLTIAPDDSLILSITTAMCSNVDGNVHCPIPSNDGPAGIVATSCSLYPCLKNYHAVVERGILSEKIVSTKPAPINWVEAGVSPSNFSTYMNYTALQSPCLVGGEWYDLSDLSEVPKTQGQLFTDINVDGTNYTAPNEYVYVFFFITGQCVYDLRQREAVWCEEKWWLASLYNNKEASFDTLRIAFDRFATTVTNKMRTTGSSNYDLSTRETVEGAVIEVSVCTQFQWQWLIMPTGLVAATTVILITIILQNLRDNRQPVWKSSLLPLLYYGFTQHAHHEDPSRPIMNLPEMDHEVADTKAKFKKGDEARFVEVMPSIDEVIKCKERDVDVDSLIEAR
ncbi:hypothetical protein F5Y13DRAFT_179191 [Hypoxylon sp. FL1857]|nr:hypothetical protein F5Y13DRAFT_179191 [Hypoxylon sp. FL1857]